MASCRLTSRELIGLTAECTATPDKPRRRCGAGGSAGFIYRFRTWTQAGCRAGTPGVLASMADHVACGRLIMPLSAVYPPEQVRESYTELAAGPAHGKIALATGMPAGTEPCGARAADAKGGAAMSWAEPW